MLRRLGAALPRVGAMGDEGHEQGDRQHGEIGARPEDFAHSLPLRLLPAPTIAYIGTRCGCETVVKR